MSWQEELRKLDEELASGQLSADDYRIRRDHVLSSAVGSEDSDRDHSPQPSTVESPAQVSQSPEQQPPPEPTAAQSPNPSGARDDETVIIAPVSPPPPPHAHAPQPTAAHNPPDADATQVVPNIATNTPGQGGATGWRSSPPADPDSTQVVPGEVTGPPGGVPAPSGPYSPGHIPPWGSAGNDVSPPWSGAEFPPLAASKQDPWVTQGPEVFSRKGGPNSKGKIVAIVLAIVVLAGIALGAYLLWGQNGSNNQTSPTPSPTSSSAPQPEKLPVATLPGKAEFHDDIKAFSDVPKLNYLNQRELQVYNGAGAGETKLVVHTLGNGNRVAVLLTQVRDNATATSAAEQLRQIQVDNGAQLAASSPANVVTSEIDIKNGQPAQIRGHYASGDVIVRVDVSSSQGLAAAQADYATIIAAQLAALPAGS